MTKAARLWLLIPALLAVAWFWPVLSHGFRSDDFLTVYYYDRDAGAVHWGRVLEEWVRPWFGVRDLYRPLVSFTFGVNWAASTAPSGFHLLNLLLFAGTVAFVALAAARLVPQRPLLAGFAAGLVVVLHPAAVEPTAWVAARTTGLQVFFSTLAYWTFLRWRDGDGRAIVPLLAVGLACASKEGAVLLPFSLLALDLVRGADRPRWRTHLPFFALVAGYLLWRRALLGVFTTAGASQTLTERAANAATLLQQLVAPPLAPAAWTLTALAVLAAVALANRRRAFWCLPWLAGLLLPGTTHVVLHDGELAGRFVFDAVPALALLVAIAFARAERWRTVIAVLAGLVALGALAVGGRAWLQRYDGDDDTVASAQRALLTAAADAAPGRPFGVTGLPDLPVLQPPLWGFLTQRPFADRDLPVVGLANVLTRNEVAPAVYGNAVALHALVTDGAGVGLWDLASRTVRPAARATSDVVELLRDAADPRRFVPPRALPPAQFAAIEIVAPTPAGRWRAAVLGDLGGTLASPPLEAVAAGGEAWLDSAPVIGWFVIATAGGAPAGIALTVDGRPAPDGTRVLAHARLPLLPAPPIVAEPIDRDDLASALGRPAIDAPLWLHVLLPTGLFAMLVPPGPVELTPAIRGELGFACDVLGPCRVHWFWRESAPEAGKPARCSAFGSCIAR